MENSINITALAQEIAKAHSYDDIIGYCSHLIGETDPNVDEYCIIEDGIDGYLDKAWWFDIRITPEVELEGAGGYPGCPEEEIEYEVADINGIDRLSVEMVEYRDQNGSWRKLSGYELCELEDELAEIYLNQ